MDNLPLTVMYGQHFYYSFAAFILICMDGLINLAILQELEEELQRDGINAERRFLRDASSPFQVREDLFIKYYRLDKHLTQDIIEIVRPHLAVHQRETSVATEIKVLTMLYFLGHGSYQKCVGLNVNLSLEQSTVSCIISEVADAFVNIMQQYIKFPHTEQKRNNLKEGFYEKFHFPGVIGAIDCTHIAIVSPLAEDPIHPGITYYKEKICDSNLIILICNARFPGSTHDSAIWPLSPVRQYLSQEFLNGNNNNYRLIGDAGYPLEPWLLTPQHYDDVDTPEGRYSQTLTRARNTIERCFGVLKQRFRCLLKYRVLHYDPVKSAKLIYSCAVLHKRNVAIPVDENEAGALEIIHNDDVLGDNPAFEQAIFLFQLLIHYIGKDLGE